MKDIHWKKAHANEHGIDTVGFGEFSQTLNVGRIVGYNGLTIGDQVLYKGELMYIVMASRLGHFGLSNTGELPYSITAYPKDVEKVKIGV